VLRYDKRSFTLNCIEHPSCWYVDTVSPYDYINDLHRAIDFAKTITNVDTCNIFLAGHSQGGSFVSQVGYDRNDVRGVLDMAGTAQPIDSIVPYQFEFINSDLAGANILRAQFDSLRNGLWPMADTLYQNHFSPRFLLDWISHSDSAIIVQKNSDKPTALMYGTVDRFVPPTIHYQIWLDSITRPNVTFQLFNDIDHAFGSEYDSTMSPQVLGFMINWIQNNVQACGTATVWNVEENSTLSVYPNPSSEIINIHLTRNTNTPFVLMDINGEIILQGILEGGKTKQVDLTRLKKGLYFLRVDESVMKIIRN